MEIIPIPVEFQDELVNFLCSIPPLNRKSNRDDLVHGLAPAIVNSIGSEGSLREHLTEIVAHASSLGKAEEGEYSGQHPLEVIMTRVSKYVDGFEKKNVLGILLKQLNDILDSLPPEIKATCLKFVNRLDEIGQITSSYAPPYYLVDAPAGYGKTRLLLESKHWFETQSWRCAYVEVNENDSLSTVTDKLARELSVDFAQTDPFLSLGNRLGGAILRNWDTSRKSLVLFIDMTKKPCLPTFAELIQRFIFDMENTLKEHLSLEPLFRVIIAGRYIAAQYEELESPKIPRAVLSLGTFDFNVVKLSIAKYLDRPDVDDLSAHLVYLTGGHPGCVAHILEMYRKQAWNIDDLLKFEQRIWDGDSYIGQGIKDVIREVVNEIPSSSDFRNLIIQLSIFRYLDTVSLRHFLEQSSTTLTDASAFADQLTATYLFRRHKRWISDDIARRLLVLWLRHDPTYQFGQLCEDAKAWCISRLSDPRQPEREVWFVEYLFQCLQCYARAILTVENRKRISSTFWKENVLIALQTYFGIETYDDIDVEKGVLIDRIKDDWEFKFTVNYYLRENCYLEQPYYELQQFIKTYQPPNFHK
jgi:hypothetical protein